MTRVTIGDGIEGGEEGKEEEGGEILAGGRADTPIQGSTRGSRGPKTIQIAPFGLF